MRAVQPQLAAIIDDLESARARLRVMSTVLPSQVWRQRPSPDAWSAADCVAHLNLTSQAMLPLLRDGVTRANGSGTRVPTRYRRDPLGWLIWNVVAPSGGFKTRTRPAFVPMTEQSAESLVADFEGLQANVISCVRAADGLAIDRVVLASPFDSRLRYNLYAALTIMPRHQHRHLLQAERAAQTITALAPASALAV